jgi:DNA-binding transcriptional MerR regulator
MDNNIRGIADEIKPYLNEIAERLWSGHATVMVGAGFSKNAHESFPNWDQLGNIFYKKIHNKEPEGHQHYLNILKLANEVQAAFGRPALDQLLRSSIPDKEYEPSSSHVKLLELPWNDVFTTNYDTLLERACTNVDSQKFDVVINKEDLVYSEKPRIIKLHGSFPSQRPLIITEEDYRKYPKDFAPFVNTVQQSLLENALCLIGFSGDDPNFLQWIGWIWDNLGKENSPKIFLIGIFDLSNAQKKLLEHRNIVLVDMSFCKDVNKDHAKALNVFFEYLRSNKKDNKLGWPTKHKFLYPDSTKEMVPQLKEIIKEWQSQRETYPNWIILPEDMRASLWTNTDAWIHICPQCKNLETPLDIEFIYELNWRQEICLCPIFNDNIDVIRSVVEKYNPFPDKLTINTALITKDNKKHNSLDWKEIERRWLELHISMIRFYREEGNLNEWKNINNRIQQLYSVLSADMIARVHYERCLYALYSLNIADVREQLKLWPIDESLPFWEAKRAALLAELGEVDEAEKILEKSLSIIRKRLNLSPISNDYSLVSREAYVMLLLRYVKDAKSLGHNFQYEQREEIRQKFSERWNYLKQYKCDPWNELELFEKVLEREPVYTAVTSKKHGFDIGIVTTSHNYGGYDTEALTAYAFLRYCEDAGIPFRMPMLNIGKKSAGGALKRIANYSPYLSFATFIRIGDSENADTILNRESIYKMTAKQVDLLIEECLDVLRKAQTEIERGDTFQKGNFGIVLAKVIPEILSRLCLKCSTSSKDTLLSFLKETYSSEHKQKYKEIKTLVERLLRSYSMQEQYARLPLLLEFPIPCNLNVIIKMEYPEPFSFIDINQKYLAMGKNVQIDKTIVIQLLQKAGSKDSDERRRAIHRIAVLHNLNLLNRDQVKEFSDVLWSQTDGPTGFPINTDYFKFAFLNFLPCPGNIDPVSLFKEYISNEKFPIQKTKAEKGVSITQGNIPICIELVRATKSPLSDKGIDWSEQEAIDIFYRLLEWWDSDKEFIKKDSNAHFFGSIGDEFKKRFANLSLILERLVIPRLSPQTAIIKELIRLLKELSEYGVPCVAAYAASICVLPEQQQDVFDKIEEAILSKQEEIIGDGYNAIYQIFILQHTGKMAEIHRDIWSFIASPIHWRCLPNLANSIKLGIRVLNDFPDAITNELLDNITLGLEYLIEETSLRNQQATIDIAKRLDIRASAALLACTLYKYYLKKNLPIPEPLEKWKSICSDIDEFSDIRNQWENCN